MMTKEIKPENSKAPERLKQLRSLNEDGVIKALNNDLSDVVRHEAAFILGERMREKDLAVPQVAFNAICVAGIFDDSILVRHETALALVNFKEYGSIRFLKFLLTDDAQEVRDSASYALEEIQEYNT